jgi:predicted TIM-barrel fold metal-dependent hydrolase
VAAAVCPNIYIELSSLMPHHISEVLAHIPSDRLMIGSDVLESAETEISKVLTLEIPPAEKENILWRTARRVFDGDSA